MDEGQDFADDWYRSLLRAADPATNSLFVAVDSSQNIYRRRLSWKAVGLQVAGRSRVLRTNYRNTRPILDAAYPVIQDLDSVAPAIRDSLDECVKPDRALRDGPAPRLERLSSATESRAHTLEWIRERLERDVAPEEILLLGLIRPEMVQLARWLEQHGLPVRMLAARRRRRRAPASVRVSTIHSSKGLDAACVLLVGAHELDQRDDAEARRLLYIAMTRARDELCVTYHRDWRLAGELARAIAASASPH